MEFEADDEEHHDDADLDEVHDVAAVLADKAEHVGADKNAGHEVAEDWAETEALGDRHGDDGGDEVDEGMEEKGIHRGSVGRRVRGGGRWGRKRGR